MQLIVPHKSIDGSMRWTQTSVLQTLAAFFSGIMPQASMSKLHSLMRRILRNLHSCTLCMLISLQSVILKPSDCNTRNHSCSLNDLSHSHCEYWPFSSWLTNTDTMKLASESHGTCIATVAKTTATQSTKKILTLCSASDQVHLLTR